MNLGKLTDFAIGIVIVAAPSGNLGAFNKWVHIQTAKLLWESRTSTWGSPLFFEKNISKR